MPIAREILSMFELGRKPSQVISVLFFTSNAKIAKDNYPLRFLLFDVKKITTDGQTLVMHRYLQSQGFRRSVGTPLHV